MTVQVYQDEAGLAAHAARRVADEVTRRPSLVLGLPTGRTPVVLYRELVALARAGQVDFGRVTTFNLDEFVGLAPEDSRSYRAFMEAQLFGPARIAPDQVRFLNGAAPDLDAECARYEEAIAAAGGIDLQLLGIGVNGHVGFNEPAQGLRARSHVAVLHPGTREANAAAFNHDPAAVPARALSMGMATILSARAIVLLATGGDKAVAVQHAIEGPVTTNVPASFLQLHPAVTWMLDEAAASRLGPSAHATAGVLSVN